MVPRPGFTTFRTPLATCWLERRTLCIVSNDVPRTPENIQEHYQILTGIIKRKVCWLLEFNTCQNFDTKVNDAITNTLPEICGNLAIFAETDCQKQSAKGTFLKFKEMGIPVKIFDREREARVWLRYQELQNKVQQHKK